MEDESRIEPEASVAEPLLEEIQGLELSPSHQVEPPNSES